MRLKEIDGIGPKRAESIVAAWADQKAIREIMITCKAMASARRQRSGSTRHTGGDTIRIISEDRREVLCFGWTYVMPDAEATWFENRWRTPCKEVVSRRVV